jgi:glycosyltransferase involved in cell wall biosynthesis
MILLSHPTGNQNSRNAARALLDEGVLAEFWTSLAWRSDGIINRILPADVRAQLERRTFRDLPAQRVRTAPWRELGRFAAPRLGLTSLTRHETGWFSVDAVFRDFDRRVAGRVRGSSGITSVYAGEDFALETFQAARERGLSRIYELPIGYWRAAQTLYREEAERVPEWAPTLGGLNDSDGKLVRKDRELQTADVIIVPSAFTRETLSLLPGPPPTVRVNPYGAPPVVSEQNLAMRRGGKSLRVLFAGALGQRKGLSYLLAAIEQLGSAVELTLLGRKTSEICAPLEAATRKHRWIPSVPHHEVLEEMERHDVLVFPSLFEGMALVVLEAFSRGLPVITTANSGGADVLRPGVDGFIVPVRSTGPIVEHLEKLIQDRGLLAEMRREARLTAMKYTWEAYRQRLVKMLRSEVDFSSGSIG